MKISRLTTNGRISIPVKLRKKYGLYPGRSVKFEFVNDRLLIIPLATTLEIRANVGVLKLKGKMLKSLIEEKKREWDL